MEAQARRRTLWKGMGKGISHPHVCFVFASGILLLLLAGLEKYSEMVTFCNPIALEQILSIGGFQRVAVFFVKVGGGNTETLSCNTAAGCSGPSPGGDPLG